MSLFLDTLPSELLTIVCTYLDFGDIQDLIEEFDYIKKDLNWWEIAKCATSDLNIELTLYFAAIGKAEIFKIFLNYTYNWIDYGIMFDGADNIEILKIFLDHDKNKRPYITSIILSILYFSNCEIEVFEYLINIEMNMDKDKLNEYLLNLLKTKNKSDNLFIKFKIIIEKYYDNIKDNLPFLYKYYIDKNIIGDKKDRYKIICYMSNLDIIKENVFSEIY